jgi:hypothetical protein
MRRDSVARFWDRLKQKKLFALGEEVGPLTATLEQLIRIWEVARIEEQVLYLAAFVGRPPSDRRAIARAFVAKAFLNIPTTVGLVDRLRADSSLRRLCGFERLMDVPSEATFSRAFAEFAQAGLGQKAHEALVKEAYGKAGIVGHVSRDATAIEAREKPLKKHVAKEESLPRRRGRPRKGEERHPRRSRLVSKSRVSPAPRWDSSWRACLRPPMLAPNGTPRASRSPGGATSSTWTSVTPECPLPPF